MKNNTMFNDGITDTNNNDLKWNVVDEKTFKEAVRKVFEKVAEALECTLGPYGSTTIIDQMGQLHITKDGWSVLKRIYFNDRMYNNILNLLTNISAQVVVKVGDGSTSSIIAANNLLKELEKDDTINKLRPKDLIDTLNKIVKDLTTKILDKSIKINKEPSTDYEEIYKLAKISTNGDEEIARMIQEIYKETQNPTIGFTESKTNKTYYEIIEGFKATGITYLDTIYANDDDNNCRVDRPILVMFNHKIGVDHIKKIYGDIVPLGIETKRRVVVIAPYYENMALDVIRRQTNSEFQGSGTTNVVFCRTSMANKTFEEQYNDFCVMTGGTIIPETDSELWLEDKLKIDKYLGSVETIIIGPHHTIIKGFTSRIDYMYQRVLNDAKAKYEELKAKHIEMNIVNGELFELSQRIAKLYGKVGMIYVGGNSSLEKMANKDLVEDAVKACESAFKYGYNIGGNLIIPIVIDEYLKENKDLTFIESDLCLKISDAFKNVFYSVLLKRAEHDMIKGYHINGTQLNQIINNCVERGTCFDLISEDYSTDIINSCFTDIEILKACVSIITLILSSNQYITALIQER